MQALLIGITIAAIFFALLPFIVESRPILILFVAAFFFVVPVCMGTLAVYCRGLRQTFFLGALAGSLTPHMLSGVFMNLGGGYRELFVLAMISLLVSGVCGYVALITRRYLERRGWHLPEKDGEPRDPVQRP
jgi:hypothetical protein